MKKIIILHFLFSLLLMSKLYAAGNIISNIKIDGNQRIESDTIISYLSLNIGSEYNKESANKSIKSLFQTGLFKDINITYNKNILNVKVLENPIINSISFEGNDKLKTEDLQKEIRLGSRSVLTTAKIQSDVNRLLNLYQKNGRFLVNIEPKITPLEHNRVDLVFEIDEGSKAVVKKIIFLNNDVFSTRSLKRVIQTKESRWYRFFSGYDTYDEDRISFDKELLRKALYN